MRVASPSEYVLQPGDTDWQYTLTDIVNSPMKYTWLGAARMASNRDVLKKLVVTRAEYEEHGGAWVARKFASQGRNI